MSGAKDFTELIAWQRANELEKFVTDIIKRPVLARDRDYCEQSSDAAASAPRNIAEGFGRFAPVQFGTSFALPLAPRWKQKTRS